MNTDLIKWNPFKFLRKNADPPATNATADTAAPRRGVQEWSDFSRFFPVEPWRAMGEFLHDPFPSFGALDRWFGDYSPSRFQPRIDVVDDGESLRVTVELPGMGREDLHTSIEGGALVLRGEKKQDIRSEGEELLPTGTGLWGVHADDPAAG